MERMLLRLLWASAMALQTPTATALDSRTEESIRASTFEFLAPSTDSARESLVGTAFAIGPNEFVTTAHLLDAAIGSHFGHPQLVDSRHVSYRLGDLLQYSEQKDYAVFTLEHPPVFRLLPVARDSLPAGPAVDVYFAGWRGDGKIVIERGKGSGLTRDEESKEFDWLRFSGPIWNSLGGGPLLDLSGRIVGIVQARARDSTANYAVSIDMLLTDMPSVAQIRGMDMLRSLMPVVSVVEPLRAQIPLPLPFAEFSRQLQQQRHEYIERTVRPLLEATRDSFVLIGAGAPETCNLLNGKACQCRGRSGLSGSLVLDNPRAEELLVRFDRGDEVAQIVAGVTVVRTPKEDDLSSNSSLHLKVALRGPARQPVVPMTLVSRKDADSEELYTDFHNRTWYLRAWPLEHQDRVMISLARQLPDGYVVLTRTMPTALSAAAAMQIEFVANLVYFGCEQSPSEGIAQLASR